MAKKFTTDPIKSPGVYEVNLFDPADNGIYDTQTIEVYINYGTGILLLDEGESLCNLEYLYENHGVSHRKIKGLKYPVTFREEDDMSEYKGQIIKVNEDQQETLQYHIDIWKEEYDSYNSPDNN